MDALLSMIVSDSSSDICEMIGLNEQRHREIYVKLKLRFEEFAAQEKNIEAQHSGGVAGGQGTANKQSEPLEYEEWAARPCAHYDSCPVKNKNLHCYANKPCFI